MSTSQISSAAQRAFTAAAAYDTHRPSYTSSSEADASSSSSKALQFLLEQTRVAGVQGAHLLDLGAGTGKFTEALAARPEKYRITAAEPHAQMREVLAKKDLPGVTVIEGGAEDLKGFVDEESVDAVFAAQAFHWFATPLALHEIHRVLQPHGVLGLIWNAEDYNSPRTHTATEPWLGKLQDLLYSCEPDARNPSQEDDHPRFRHMRWREVFDDAQIRANPFKLMVAGVTSTLGLDGGEEGNAGDGKAREEGSKSGAASQLFALPLGEYQEHFEHLLTEEELWGRFSSLGHIAEMGGEEKERVHQAFLKILEDPSAEKDAQGRLTVHGDIHIYWTSKIPSEGRSTLFSVERS